MPELIDNSKTSIKETVAGEVNPSSTSTTTPKPNPGAAMMFFFLVTSGYCILCIFLGGDSTQKLVMKVCYFLFVVIGEYFINLNLSESMCGIRQWNTTLYITLVPWIMIFGVLHLFLTMFPGWLTPFSNTFGYLVAKLMGLPDLMRTILEKIGDGEASQALISVSTDSSLLINQFTPESYVIEKDLSGVPTGRKIREQFETAWAKLKSGKIIKGDADENMKNKLYGFIELKFIVSEYVWNLLTGLLVTSISYNYIISAGCSKSPKEMKERYDAYEAAAKKRKIDKDKQAANQPNYVQQP